MRYLDELLATYPARNPAGRKFLLAQLLDHARDRFAGEAAELLWRELAASEPLVAHQARYTLGQWLPALGAARLGPGAREAGATPEALAALAPLIRRLESLADAGPHAPLALLALGRLQDPATRARLSGARDFAQAAALAETGGPEASAALLAAIPRRGADEPDLYMLLRALPDPAATAVLRHGEPSAGAHGRANIALALGLAPADSCRDLLERLLKRQEGWVTAYALEALAGSAQPADLRLIQLAHDLDAQEFGRTLALRAAGLVRSPEATAFCLAVARGPASRMQALALKGLAHQGLPDAELARAAEPLLASEFLRNRVQAVLAVSRVDPERGRDALNEMALSEESLLRMEAAYLLGHAPTDASRALLELMLAEDPSPQVRCQAVVALARHGNGAALEPVAAALASSDDTVAATAARALSGAPADAAPAALAAAVHATSRAAARPHALTALGQLAARAGQPPPPALLAALKSGEEAAAALDALLPLGDAIPPDALARLVRSPDPGLAARAAVAAAAGGDLGPLLALEPRLVASPDERASESVRALLTASLLVTAAPGHGRFTRLCRVIAPAVAAPSGAPYGATVPLPVVVPLRAARACAARPLAPGITRTPSDRTLDALARDYAERARAGRLGAVQLPPAGWVPGAATDATLADTPRRTAATGATLVGAPGVRDSAPAVPRPSRGTRPYPTSSGAARPPADDTGPRSDGLRRTTRREAAAPGVTGTTLVGGPELAGELVPPDPPETPARADDAKTPEASNQSGVLALARSPAALAATAVVLLAAALLPLARRAETPSDPVVHLSPARADALPRVWLSEGQCTRASPGESERALKTGEALSPGTVVAAGASSRLRLEDRTGNSLELTSGSRVTILASDADAPPQELAWSARDPGGDCKFDLRQSAKSVVQIGRTRVIAHAAAFATHDTSAGTQVELISGDAVIARNENDRRSLTIGNPVVATDGR